MNANLYAFVDGKGEVVAAFDFLNEECQRLVRQVVENNAKAVTAWAIRRVPKRSGELASTIRWDFIVDRGIDTVAAVLAGYGKLRRGLGNGKRRPRFKRGRRAKVNPLAKAREGKGAYAPVIEFKHKSFLFSSARIQRSTFYDDLRKALNDATRKAAVASRRAA